MNDDYAKVQLILSQLLPALRAPDVHREHLQYLAFAIRLDLPEEGITHNVGQAVGELAYRFPTLERRALTAEVVEAWVTPDRDFRVTVRFVDSPEELAAPALVPASEAA